MIDLDASLTFTAGGVDLPVDESAGLVLVRVGITPRRWRRHTVEGRYQHGRALLGAVLEQATLTARVRATGDTWPAAAASWNTLVEVVSQHAYTATVVVESAATTLACEPADIALASGDDMWEELELMSAMQTFVLTIPARPL